MQVSGTVSKRAFNESTVYYSSRHSCNNAHSSSIWSIVSVWPQWWQPVGGPRDKLWDMVALAWPIRSRVITTSSALVRWGYFFGGPSVGVKDRDFCHVQLHSTWFEPTSECRSWPAVSYLYSGHLPVGLYLGRESLLLVDPLFHFRQYHSGLVPSRNEQVCPSHSMTRAGSWYGK